MGSTYDSLGDIDPESGDFESVAAAIGEAEEYSAEAVSHLNKRGDDIDYELLEPEDGINAGPQ